MKVTVPKAKATLLGKGQVYRTPSSSRVGRYHYTFLLEGQDPWCTCEGFAYNERCRHIKELVGEY